MARIALNPPPNNSFELNTGDSLERGDSPKKVIDSINAMMAEIYSVKSNFAYGAGSRWFLSREGGFGSGTCPANSLRLTPFYIYAPVTIDALGIVVNTAEAAKSVQLGIYASDPANNNKVTGLPLCQTASISVAVTGAFFATVTPVTLQPGLYYMGRNSDSTTAATANATGATGAPSPWGSMVGTLTLANLLAGTGSTLSSLVGGSPTFGTWPDLTATTPTEVLGSSGSPAPVFRVQ